MRTIWRSVTVNSEGTYEQLVFKSVHLMPPKGPHLTYTSLKTLFNTRPFTLSLSLQVLSDK